MTTLIGNEKFIEVATGEYPLDFDQVKRKLPNVLFGANVSVEELAGFGFKAVAQNVHAVGDVVTEGAPQEVNGNYQEVWNVRPFNEEELASQLNNRKAELLSSVDELLTQALTGGVPYDFGGEYGIQHIQLRDGDRANLAGVRVLAESVPQLPHTFRTHENNNITLDAAGAINMTNAALSGYVGVLGTAWALKDQIKAATTVAELPAIPPTLV